jgi:hypothetical protein
MSAAAGGTLANIQVTLGSLVPWAAMKESLEHLNLNLSWPTQAGLLRLASPCTLTTAWPCSSSAGAAAGRPGGGTRQRSARSESTQTEMAADPVEIIV